MNHSQRNPWSRRRVPGAGAWPTFALVAGCLMVGAFGFSHGGRVFEADLARAANPLGARGGVRDIDWNQDRRVQTTRTISAAQQAALDGFRQAHPNTVAHWDKFSGSLDIMYGFASNPSSSGPEAAARAFIGSYPNLLGVTDLSTLELDATNSKEALGGYLLRFNQTVQGVPVQHAGLGVVLDGSKRVRAIAGPYYTGIAIGTSPSLSATAAVDVARNDLAPQARNLPAEWQSYLTRGFEILEEQLGLATTPHPALTIYPTATGYRLAWQFLFYTRDPFGLYRYTVDAHSGEILTRENQVRTQQEPVQASGDYFPTSPPITAALQDRGAILDANGQEVGTPAGQIRIALRKFNASNAATGTEDVLSGTHALIQSALASKLPFAQAAASTYHFAQDNQPVEGRTNEVDHLAEPAEHQDAISQFIYITSLIEYLLYLHRDGDAVHNRGVGEGDFPERFPNDETPLTGTVHIPNVLEDICGQIAEPTEDPDAFLRTLLACDNAFAIPASFTVAGQEIVVNPTAYGHGYLFNNLGIDFAVPLHEGTHATITPIAGFEGSPEGGALNEGQADLWAYTVGENPSLGAYIVNGFRLRQLLRDTGTDPNTWQWIRNAESQLRYSQLGTRDNQFEVHRDGEIYAGAMWDIRQLMLRFQTSGGFFRPDQITGEPTQPTSLGKETWERLFLGSMYVLGLFSPDTFVRARDAMLIADAVLYPSDPLNLEAPGRHHALIERMFAAREVGRNAEPPMAGIQGVSTAVSSFTAGKTLTQAPQRVTAEPIAPDQVLVSWQPVDGAIAYQVLKRRAGTFDERLFTGVPGREYHDGDQAFSGFTHVEYTYGGDATSYVDNGQAIGRSPGLGLTSLDFDYVVRAIGFADDGQIAFSALSGTASVAKRNRTVTKNVDSDFSNVTFSNGVFAFDQTLTNTGGAGTFDGTIFAPITFKVVDISRPTVTVINADNGGSGQNGDEAHFVYDQSLRVGETSAPRRLEFANPDAELFTFDAVVTGFVRSQARAARGSQDPVDEAEFQPRPETFHYVEEFTGVIPIGTAGLQAAEGVDYVDVPFTTRASAVLVTGTLSADPSLSPYPDLDFYLLDSDGNEINASESFGPDEQVGAAVEGDRTYVYRVVGFINGPGTFRIVSDQQVSDPNDAGGDASGSPTDAALTTNLLRFTVNPLTGGVAVSVIW